MRQPNGRYRVLASRFAPGKPLGNFRYHGTRPDDPNDIVPHEHRRELRGARVFGAWLNHDDSRGVNSLDMLESRDGRGYIKHYMFDFGSTLGSGTVFAQRERAGNRVHPPVGRRLPDACVAGVLHAPLDDDRLSGCAAGGRTIRRRCLRSREMAAEYPNPAFDNMRPDDAFWAAKIVARFTDDMIRAIVAKARYTDPARNRLHHQDDHQATRQSPADVVERGQPRGRCRARSSGVLTFGNAAIAAGVAEPPESYTCSGSTSTTPPTTQNVGDAVTVTSPRAQAPDALLAGTGGYIGVTITAKHPCSSRGPSRPTSISAAPRAAGSGWVQSGSSKCMRGLSTRSSLE